MTAPSSKVQVSARYETIAWRWMRYSAFLLIPLVWGHVLLQDVIVGGHAINLDYVVLRWSLLGWRIYDFFLLAFAFAHGVNGLRQVLMDYFHHPNIQRLIDWGLFSLWIILSLIGAAAIIGGVRLPLQ